jgi:hypothetical protein
MLTSGKDDPVNDQTSRRQCRASEESKISKRHDR